MSRRRDETGCLTLQEKRGTAMGDFLFSDEGKRRKGKSLLESGGETGSSLKNSLERPAVEGVGQARFEFKGEVKKAAIYQGGEWMIANAGDAIRLLLTREGRDVPPCSWGASGSETRTKEGRPGAESEDRW